jgi:hypothetical protein
MRLIFVLFSFFCFSLVLAQNEWKLAKEENGVKVFVRDHIHSNRKEFKAFTEFHNVTLNQLFMLFKNTHLAPQWSYAITYAEKLDSISPTEKIVYFQSELPFPLADRDIVLSQKLYWKNENEFVCEAKSIPAYRLKNKKFVRVSDSNTIWTFKKADAKSVWVSYEFYTDPQVPLPASFIKIFMVRTPLLVFEKFKKYLESTSTKP